MTDGDLTGIAVGHAGHGVRRNPPVGRQPQRDEGQESQHGAEPMAQQYVSRQTGFGGANIIRTEDAQYNEGNDGVQEPPMVEKVVNGAGAMASAIVHAPGNLLHSAVKAAGNDYLSNP